MTRAPQKAGLDALNARVREDLLNLGLPSKAWVPRQSHQGQAVRDVVVIGAGMCGLAALAQLRLSGIDNCVAYDRSPDGLEGPWITFARMNTLRSPKVLTGPALGLPALTFRAWYTAQFGTDGWDRLDKIPKEQWMDYLVWYRHILALPIENEVRLLSIDAATDDLVALRLEDKSGTRTEFARHLVLATGRSGLGGMLVPDFLDGLDPALWAHGADDIDFEALKGKDIAARKCRKSTR
jgi:cation diffusion facilitator CzcD-associated flavoprotein CzcO